jgi:cell division protein FtsW (lipid II flippase)
MTGAVFILLLIAVAALVFVAGLTPFLFVPIAIVLLFVFVVPAVGGGARKSAQPDPEESRSHRPGTADASYDPAGGPQH